jgi:putative FmdB family regulatory protein
MPIYDFRCRECKKEFTLVLRLAEYEKRERACPHCQSKEVERVMTGCTVVTSRKS